MVVLPTLALIFSFSVFPNFLLWLCLSFLVLLFHFGLNFPDFFWHLLFTYWLLPPMDTTKQQQPQYFPLLNTHYVPGTVLSVASSNLNLKIAPPKTRFCQSFHFINEKKKWGSERISELVNDNSRVPINCIPCHPKIHSLPTLALAKALALGS